MPRQGIVFLMYHELEAPGRVLRQSAAGYMRYAVRKEEFQSQMAWLHRNQWKGLSVSEALSYPSGTTVAITFDDGCESDLEVAAPILKDLGYHATFYVTAGFLDKRGYLSSSQLRELSSSGFEIGCHSMTHTYLDDIDPSRLQYEISDARIKLEDSIGNRVDHFSCPGGRYNAAAVAFAKKAGYRSLATSHVRVNLPSTDPFLLGRVAIMRNTDETALMRVCDGTGLRKAQWTESARGAARKLMGNVLYDRLRSALLRQP
jgi:peptidoglycan/xylan/chitin deacetylase (PgdA/CDA1 family)